MEFTAATFAPAPRRRSGERKDRHLAENKTVSCSAWSEIYPSIPSGGDTTKNTFVDKAAVPSAPSRISPISHFRRCPEPCSTEFINTVRIL